MPIVNPSSIDPTPVTCLQCDHRGWLMDFWDDDQEHTRQKVPCQRCRPRWCATCQFYTSEGHKCPPKETTT